MGVDLKVNVPLTEWEFDHKVTSNVFQKVIEHTINIKAIQNLILFSEPQDEKTQKLMTESVCKEIGMMHSMRKVILLLLFIKLFKIIYLINKVLAICPFLNIKSLLTIKAHLEINLKKYVGVQVETTGIYNLLRPTRDDVKKWLEIAGPDEHKIVLAPRLNLFMDTITEQVT